MVVVSHTTTLSVLGAGMALRGPDGSMMTATDGLYEERMAVFKIFGIGLVCTVGSVVICVWLILHWESALVCMVITVLACRTIYQNYMRVMNRFSFNESETVDFRDIMEGPAAIRAVPWRMMFGSNVSADYDDKPKSSFDDVEDLQGNGWNQNLVEKDCMKRRGNRTPPLNGEEQVHIRTI